MKAPENNRKGRRAQQQRVTSDPNPEGLSETPTNTLFGKPEKSKKRKSVDEAEEDAPKPQKMARRTTVLKGDPAAELAAAGAKRKAAAVKEAKSLGGKKGTTSTESRSAKPTKSIRPHADAVERSTRIWETLRADKTGADEVWRRLAA